MYVEGGSKRVVLADAPVPGGLAESLRQPPDPAHPALPQDTWPLVGRRRNSRPSQPRDHREGKGREGKRTKQVPIPCSLPEVVLNH